LKDEIDVLVRKEEDLNERFCLTILRGFGYREEVFPRL
jgi:hypothetical protein